MTIGDSVTFTREEISKVLNRACDEIAEEAGLPDSGTIDALNLLVNATLFYLDNPGGDLAGVAESNYDIDPDDLEDGRTALDVVIDWING
jgi:hypothetical protein